MCQLNNWATEADVYEFIALIIRSRTMLPSKLFCKLSYTWLVTNELVTSLCIILHGPTNASHNSNDYYEQPFCNTYFYFSNKNE